MSKFIGKGWLLAVEEYETKKGPDGKELEKAEKRYKYTFLVGEENDQGYIVNATIETCISKNRLLRGNETLLCVVDIELTMADVWEKVDGRNVKVRKPVYALCDVSAKK